MNKELEDYAVESPTQPQTFVFEGNIFEACDAYYETRQARLAADKVAADLKVRETQLQEHLIRELNHQEAAQGVSGSKARVTLKRENTPVVKDWDEFYKWVRENNAFEFLQRRLNTKPVKERWTENEQVPGVGEFPVFKLSVAKV